MIGLGIGINYSRVLASIDPQAQAHYDRVVADGGIIPAGLLGCNAWFVAVKAVYNTTDITTAISAGYDPHYLGAKIGAGSGTTLGQAATKLYSCSGASGDLVQATAASMPLLLVKNASDANYWFGSGVLGNYCSTPNAAANQILGNIEFVVSNAIFDYSGNYAFCTSGNTSANREFIFAVEAGVLKFYQSFDGSSFDTATASVSLSTAGYTATNNIWIKLTRSSSTGDVKFYGSTDGITYNQIGATITSTTGNRFNSNTSKLVGTWNNSAYHYLGKIGRLTISNSIGGTPVVDFNPASYNAATSQTQWTSTSGEVWTINTGTDISGYKGVLVDRTILQGDGVDDTIVSSTTLSITSNTRYVALNPYVLTSGYMISGALGGSEDRHLTYISGTSLRAFSGSNFITYAGVVASKLQLFQATYNAASSQVSLNNSNNVTGTIDINNIDNLRIFSATGSSFKNMNLNTLIETASGVIDNSTIRTAMYNAIKSFNGNSF